MPAWRWMEGMRATNGARVINVCGDGFVEGFLGAQMVEVDSEAVPDWDDPATVGCLLSQVREKHGKSCTSYRDGRGWCVMRLLDPESSVSITPDYKTEVEALLAALEG